jgi:Type II CAAX prenyl endopeptidase Rce1-like
VPSTKPARGEYNNRMRDPRRGPEREDIAAAAVVGVPFAFYTLFMLAVQPPTAAAWTAADPILHLGPAPFFAWLLPLSGLAAALAWWCAARPSVAVLWSALLEGVFGALAAAVLVLALGLAHGPTLPSFVPPEESAAPGFGLSMAAGYGEEVVCRLALGPLLFFWLRQRTRWAGAVSVVATAFFFAIWHAAGEDAFSATYFTTRFILPGCIMGGVWLASPSMIVAGHSAAHLLVPWLFVPR